MDAKFKAGFPDLYLILSGVDRPKHYELKVIDKDNKDLRQYFKPIQISVMISISKAGADARGLIYVKETQEVLMKDFHTGEFKCFGEEAFFRFWTSSCHSWAEAERS